MTVHPMKRSKPLSQLPLVFKKDVHLLQKAYRLGFIVFFLILLHLDMFISRFII